ncbi:hypothetical protein J7I91_14595 [Pseudomonas sp. ISL-84]|nr:hypothetical protein [Pseudomonas sp. ISL-84]
MKIKIVLAASLISIILAGCGQADSNDEDAVKPDDIKALVNDYSVGNIKSGSASITSEQLLVKEADGDELAYDLPKEEFFVSIAPYVNETHP